MFIKNFANKKPVYYICKRDGVKNKNLEQNDK